MKQLTLIIAEFLGDYNGRSKEILEEIAARFTDHQDYIDSLIELIVAPENTCSDGATWLIKHYVENDGKLSSPQIESFLTQLPKITYWVAQLHICQSLRYLSIPLTQTNQICEWLTPLLDHKRPFLRAWSLDGLCYLAAVDPDCESQANQALAKAIADPAASVRARAKNLHH